MVIAGICLVLVLGAFVFGRTLAIWRFSVSQAAPAQRAPHSLPNFHGYFVAWLTGFICLGAIFVWAALAAPGHRTVLIGIMVLLALVCLLISMRCTHRAFRARDHVERFVRLALLLCSGAAIFITFGIVFALVFESLRFFEQVSILDFLTGLKWSPQATLPLEGEGTTNTFGAIPVFTGTFLIMAIAMTIAVPIGLLIAVYLSEYASARARALIKPVVEILAGIPTVVYGFFALLTVGPALHSFAANLGFDTPSQSAIAAGTVMGFMIVPFISSLSDDVINAVPQNLRNGSYAMGATKSETIQKIVLPAALPGISGAVLLAVSRAIGETMIVLMAAGRAANLTLNPFETVSTVTVQIVSLLTGDQEFNSAKTLAAYALGLALFVITLLLNIVALIIVRRHTARFS